MQTIRLTSFLSKSIPPFSFIHKQLDTEVISCVAPTIEKQYNRMGVNTVHSHTLEPTHFAIVRSISTSDEANLYILITILCK